MTRREIFKGIVLTVGLSLDPQGSICMRMCSHCILIDYLLVDMNCPSPDVVKAKAVAIKKAAEPIDARCRAEVTSITAAKSGKGAGAGGGRDWEVGGRRSKPDREGSSGAGVVAAVVVLALVLFFGGLALGLMHYAHKSCPLKMKHRCDVFGCVRAYLQVN